MVQHATDHTLPPVTATKRTKLIENTTHQQHWTAPVQPAKHFSEAAHVALALLQNVIARGCLGLKQMRRGRSGIGFLDSASKSKSKEGTTPGGIKNFPHAIFQLSRY